ncbi:MAG: hypothetical protein Q4D44_03200 [Eubacteriales bacterium]|nr:hypothetical protein [Eubacteriales bacterium]
MITIQNGKFYIPESDRFIGFAGDNLRKTIEFLVKDEAKASDIYRLYLTFDDGAVNFFTLPAKECDEGVLLTWNILETHIFKGGILKAQIKAFADGGVIWHTNTDRFIVGKTAEYPDSPDSMKNSEFLEYEKALNGIRDEIKEERGFLPYIGDNGNWFCYDTESNTYKDSGKPSSGKAQSGDIADGAVTTVKLADGAVTRSKMSGSFMEIINRNPVRTFADLDSIISEENSELTLYRLSVGGLGELYPILGSGPFICFVADESMYLIDTVTKATWNYISGSGEIVRHTVKTQDIADGAVTSEKLANGAVRSEQIGFKSVYNVNLKDGAVTTRVIADGTVTADKISDGAVSRSKMSGNFMEKISRSPVRTFGDLDSIISEENASCYLYHIYIGGLGELYPLLGSGPYLGYVTDNSILLINTLTKASWRYESGSAEITRQLVDSKDISENAITTDKLADNAITSEKIPEGAKVSLTMEQIEALDKLFSKASYVDENVSSAYSEFVTAFGLDEYRALRVLEANDIVPAGCSNYYDYPGGYRYEDIPYTTTGMSRCCYPHFDIPAEGGYSYQVYFEANAGVKMCIEFYNENVLEAVSNGDNYNSADRKDGYGWQDSMGYEWTPPTLQNGSPIKCMRFIWNTKDAGVKKVVVYRKKVM